MMFRLPLIHLISILFKPVLGTKQWMLPSEHATSVQRLPNVVQTSMTFGPRWVDVVKMPSVHCVGAQDRPRKRRMHNEKSI